MTFKSTQYHTLVLDYREKKVVADLVVSPTATYAATARHFTGTKPIGSFLAAG